jgi:SAM-dependent methyltransferase
MRPKPSRRAWGLALATAVLTLIPGCRDLTLPAPRDKASLAPYVASMEIVVERLLQLAEVGKDDVVYDLGSGDGRIVIMAAKHFGARGVGYELDGELVRRSTENARRAGVADLVRFHQQDVMTVDLSPATVVTIYLGREANLKLRPALQSQLRPGARVVSHDFDMGDWAPDAVQQVLEESGITKTLYLWRITRPKP